MKIGVGVEVPSDRDFLHKVLHKYFKPAQFDIRIMKSREKLIRNAPRLLNAFKDAKYDLAILLIDEDKEPCVSAVIELFDPTLQKEARKEKMHRYLFICVAIRALEAWLLADSQGIKKVLPNAKYSSPAETGEVGIGGILKKLWEEEYGNIALNKLSFAKAMASKFNPKHAKKRSASFRYFWECLENRILKYERNHI